MSSQVRGVAIENFRENKTITALLVSPRVGGIGLNLIEANHVLLVDPWWNGTLEDQAIDRVHRYGQTKEVRVQRFFCKNTIEAKIIELNRRKRELIQAALVCNTEERKKHNLEDIMYLMKSFNSMKD